MTRARASWVGRAHVKKKRERQRMRALAGFDPNGHAALQIQDFYRKYTKKLKNLAAEAKKRAHDEKVAEKNRAADEAKAKAGALAKITRATIEPSILEMVEPVFPIDR